MTQKEKRKLLKKTREHVRKSLNNQIEAEDIFNEACKTLRRLERVKTTD